MTDEEATAMHTTTGVRGWLTVYLKGLAMGAADSVPGVSGGTIALIAGIYERLIDALTALNPRVLTQIPDLDTADGRHRFVADLRGMDVFFLVALGLGVVTSIVTISRVVHVALEMARPQTFAFFFGLIAASAVVLYDQLSLGTPLEIGSAVAGFLIAFVVSGVSTGAGLGHALPLIFLAGSVAISAMVLPGISGAFILILLGQYEYLTGVLTNLVDGVLAFGAGNLLANLAVVVTFGGGAVVGLFTVAHGVRRALDEYREATIAFLVSLMVGSLRLPVAEVAGGVELTALPAVTTALGAALAGAVAVLLLDYYTEDLSTVAA
jgi:putative membrane protein